MPDTPIFLSRRPGDQDDAPDVMSEVLDAVHLTTAVFGRVELGAPWHLRISERPYLSFYVIARGSAWLTVDDARAARGHDGESGGGCDGSGPRAVPLSLGDAVLLPRGSAHTLRDAAQSEAPAHDFDYAGCARAAAGARRALGGAGPTTVLVTGHFTFGGASRNPLLAALPAAIHLPADTTASPALGGGPLGGVVPLIVAESTAAAPGSARALARLADLLLVHTLRHLTAARPGACGLRALSDPAIGAALRLMHARPAEPWTVAGLAAAVALSRSAFATRFATLVGESPLQYLARWRMSTAARLLADGHLSVAAVAERVGYANPVAFTKAFARVQGVGPGAFRRRERHPVAA